jgi:thiol-disulfide isomerase/thioredoxin
LPVFVLTLFFSRHAALAVPADDLGAERLSTIRALDQLLDNGKLFGGDDKAQTAGTTKALAAMNRVLAVNQRCVRAGVLTADAAQQWQVILHIRQLALGDAAARRLNDAALAHRRDDPVNANRAAVCRAAAHYLTAGSDESAQLKALDELEDASRPVAADSQLLFLTQVFASDNPPATAAIARRLVSYLKNGPDNLDWSHRADEELGPVGDMESRARRMEILHQPITIEGTLVDGTGFSTAQWKGKVVLVGFWGSWCGPCIAEIPAMSKRYAKNHAAGLEMLNVAADAKLPALQAVIDKHAALTWPQMYSPGADDKPLSWSFGVNHYPTVFLIDRQGVLRSIDEPDLDAAIARLLGESP